MVVRAHNFLFFFHSLESSSSVHRTNFPSIAIIEEKKKVKENERI